MSFLRNLFSNKSNDEQKKEMESSPLPPAPPVEVKKEEPTWVYIWSTSARNGVGHAALQAGGSQPKFHIYNQDQGSYAGIWPKNIPSFGPLGFVPFKASVSPSVMKDAIIEGSSLHPDHVNSEEFGRGSNGQEASQPFNLPDKVYKVNGLNTAAIQKEIRRVNRKADTGEVRYQLFPNINLFCGTANAINKTLAHTTPRSLGMMSANPFSDQPNDKLNDSVRSMRPKFFKSYNCTLLTEDLLKKGGMDIPENAVRLPWEITPSGLAEVIEKDPRAEKVDLSTYQHNHSRHKR